MDKAKGTTRNVMSAKKLVIESARCRTECWSFSLTSHLP